MQMLGPETSDPNVHENGIGIRTFSFLHPYGRERQHMVAFSQQALKIDSSLLWAPTRLS
jgi:hypothetical protein